MKKLLVPSQSFKLENKLKSSSLVEKSDTEKAGKKSTPIRRTAVRETGLSLGIMEAQLRTP